MGQEGADMLLRVGMITFTVLSVLQAAQAQAPDMRPLNPAQPIQGGVRGAAPIAPGTTFRAVCDTAGGSCAVRDSSPIPPGSDCSCGNLEGTTR